MIGYKAFDENLKCRGFQFEVGKTYETGAEKIELCTETVFHFCRELHKIEIVSDYSLTKSRVCEVIAEGDIVDDGDKYGTNKITILREIPEEELRKYNHYNSGNYNSGNCNSGNYNSGNCNSGNYNSGNCNSGNYNRGNYNRGNYNSGSHNSGSHNSGNYNSGSYNSGSHNSGSHNSGSHNSGNYNSGSHNSGSHNSGNCNSGYFNTTSSIRFFNKEIDVAKMDNVVFPDFLFFHLTEWIPHYKATDEEKQQYRTEIEATGGFLKKLEYKDAFRVAYDGASRVEHAKLFMLPNFDKEIFKQISGIDVTEEYNEWKKVLDKKIK